LFCDLVGSTEIATQLDPEEWREVVAGYHRAATEAITQFGGYIAQYLGDGVMAYFGWPEAHDNNAERALRAGLAIIDAVTKLNEHNGRQKLSTRVGIDSGAVVVGAGIGSKTDIFGDTPNIAARVQAAALPDTVMITAGTHRLISGLFVVEDRGKQRLKGIRQPFQLYRVIRPSDVQGRLQAVAAAHALTPFIGRDDELRLLMNRWERALEGEPQMVLISGEGGIGKSRLVQRFHQQIAGRPYYWVEGVASPFFQNTPFYPVAGVVRELQAQYPNVPGQVSGTARHQEYGTRTRPSGTGGSNGHSGSGAFSGKDEQTQLASQLSVIKLNSSRELAVAMVALSLSEPAEHTLSPPPKRWLLSTLVEWLLGVAQVVPLVIAIEDLHWADPSTLELLQLPAEQAASAPLMLLCTARPEFRAKWPPRMHDTQITLGPLSMHNARTLVLLVIEQKTLAEETIRTVVERTGGVPLFIEELTRALLESDKVELAGREIPATLHDSLIARLDRLGAARETLQVGAVLGLEFTYKLLLAATHLHEDELQRHLLALTDAELLYVRGLLPDATYHFKHALIRDAAYEALLRSRRRELHAHIAETIEKSFPEQSAAHPEILAYHYTEAGLVAQAVRYWREAGRSANARSAYAEAISHFNSGLELVKSLPETPERTSEELRLQIALTEPLTATKGFSAPEVEKACSRAFELCQQIGETPQLFAALGSLYSVYANRGDFQKSLELAHEMLRLAENQQEPLLLLWAHYCLGHTLSLRGELEAGRAHIEQSILLYDFEHSREYGFVQDPGATGLAGLANLLCLLGYPDQALEKSLKALAHARKLSQPFTLAWVLGSVGAMHARRGEFQEAELLWTEQVELCTEHNFPSLLASGIAGRAMAMVEQGRGQEVISRIRSGLEPLPAAHAPPEQSAYLLRLAYAYRRLGWSKEGLAVVVQALKLLKQTSIPESADLYYLKGEMLLMEDSSNRSEPEQCFRAAIQIARTQGAKTKELEATTSLARLIAGEGRRDEARAMLAEIYNWFTEGFDLSDLKQAKALLDELSH
jgi:class 3 adenylate cyclase/tetratricopeptide (TPR) repeat protein